MKSNEKLTKEQEDSNRLELEDILNSDDPEIKQFMVNAIKEEISKVNLNASKDRIEAMEKATDEAIERGTMRTAWHFKDKLTPQIQRILEEQYPDPDVA